MDIHELIIDSELDIYNDYMTLYLIFGDQKYKDKADEAIKTLQRKYGD